MTLSLDTQPRLEGDALGAVAGAIETVESHLHPTPSWNLDDHPMPDGREEIWRFTPIKRVKALLTEGATSAQLTWDESALAPFAVREISHDEARDLGAVAPSDRIAALAVANSSGPARVLEIPANTELTEPLHLKLNGTGTDEAVFQNWVIKVGANSHLTLVVSYTGNAKLAENLSIEVGNGTTFNLVTLQDWDDQSVHAGQRSLLVGRDAQVTTVTASVGGQVVRLQENSSYAGPGGTLNAYGVYFVDADQHVQHRLFVDHNAPNTVSDVDYRGALHGKGAHSVWIGDVLIRKVAENIETYESNKNLVLTDGCQADSVPNLEIETGNIAGAGHSSSTGRFDDEQLFYLRARGISEAEARRLVVHGFFNEIIRRIRVPQIEAHLMGIVDNELAFLGDAK